MLFFHRHLSLCPQLGVGWGSASWADSAGGGGGGGLGGLTPLLRGKTHTPGQTPPPPCPDTPTPNPLTAPTPARHHPPPPPQPDTTPLPHTVNHRSVRIVLECILVSTVIEKSQGTQLG